MNCPRCHFDFCWFCMNSNRTHGPLNMCVGSILPFNLSVISGILLQLLFIALVPILAVVVPTLVALVLGLCLCPFAYFETLPLGLHSAEKKYKVLWTLFSCICLLPLILAIAALLIPIFLLMTLPMQVILWHNIGNLIKATIDR